jgi:hypothetical protein
MGKNFTAVFAVCLAISALPLACGDDEDDDGGGDGGKGGKGGSSGSTNGGTAGGGKGGTSGTGGTTGGTAGTGGKGGAGGTTGGSAGTGGTMGGEGGMGGAEGGMGGEGGGGEPPLPLCDRVCNTGEAGNCDDDHAACVSNCEYVFAYGGDACEDPITAMLECWAAGTGSWTCAGTHPGYQGAECDDEETAASGAGCVP